MYASFHEYFKIILLLIPSATNIENNLSQALKSENAFFDNNMYYQLGLTPEWFKDIDTLFEFVSIVVTFLLAAATYKFYKLTEETKYKWFSASFFLIMISYVFKILTNIIVYNEQLGTQVLGKYTYTVQYMHEYYYFEIFGTLAFRFLMLVGLFGLYYIICRCQDRKTIMLMIFLLFFTTIFSNIQYFTYHLTAALLLAVIVHQYYELCRQQKKKLFHFSNPMIAFGALLLSQIVFSLLFLTPKIYVFAEIIQLFGFLLLLYNYIRMVFGK